jgi:hypothetical protein
MMHFLGDRVENASSMPYILRYSYKVWSWLLVGASRATVILVFITGFYAILTWRMAKAISSQTHAMIQPVALLQFHWKEEEYYPAGYFEIKNLGAQPFLLLDVKLSCHRYGRSFTEHYTLWDEHIIPPGDSLCPQFDFKRRFEKEKLSWSPSASLSYSLEVVTSDLSKHVVLTYQNIPVLAVVNVRKGMSLAVRWRYFLKPVEWRYGRLLNRFRRPGSQK